MNRRNFFAELKRRNVYKVAIAYAIVAWLLMQAASILFPTFEAPPWTMKVFVAVIALGFPIALVLAWAFELTPEGIKRAEDVDLSKSVTRKTSGSTNSARAREGDCESVSHASAPTLPVHGRFLLARQFLGCKTAQVGETPRESVCLAPPLRMRAWSCSIRSLFSARSFVSAVFNGEFGNSRDASVHTDGAKSRCPKRVARALRRRNSLHMAIQIWGGACPRYHFGDCGPNSAQAEQSDETVSLISL